MDGDQYPEAGKPFIQHAAFELSLQRIDISSPFEIDINITTATSGITLDDRDTRNFLNCTFQRFGDSDHHSVNRLLPGIGNHGDPLGIKTPQETDSSASAAVTIYARHHDKQAYKHDWLAINLMKTFLLYRIHLQAILRFSLCRRPVIDNYL